jgi:hypothetical protein
MASNNRYGFDVGNTGDDEGRFVERDYSIGGGVTMHRRDFEHGFGGGANQYDRIRGTWGTKRGEHYGKGPRNWRRSDEQLREEVCKVLTQDPHVDATDIDVTVEDGLVLLAGWVDSRQEKREAEDCLEHVLGIRDVRNELHLRNRKAPPLQPQS